MWSIIFLILLIIILVFSKFAFGTIRTPISIYCLIWAFVGCVANVGLYEYYLPSNFVNFIIFLSVILAFGCYGIGMQGVKKGQLITEIQMEDTYINFKMILLINIVCIVLLIPALNNSIKLLFSDGFAFLRANDDTIYMSSAYAVLVDSIIRPIYTATSIVSVVYLLSTENGRKKSILLILAIIGNLELLFLSAGRSSFVNFLFYLVIGIVLFNGRNLYTILRKVWKYIALIAIVVLIIISVTSARGMTNLGESKILYNLYVYYFSGPSYLTQLLEKYSTYGIGGELLFGAATFGFVTNIWSNVIMFFTGEPQGSLYLLGSVITNRYLRVGDNTLINAMCTGFYPFLIDFGYLGIFLGPIFIAIVSVIMTKKVCKKANVMNVSLYIFWIYVLIRTVFKWDLVNLDLSVVIVTLWLYTRRKKRKAQI